MGRAVKDGLGRARTWKRRLDSRKFAWSSMTRSND